MTRKAIGCIAAATAASVALGSSAMAKDTLSVVTSLQQTNTIAISFLTNFYAVANKRGGGLVQIKNLGGQEIVPPRKAANALKRGQFDMLHSPTAYYIGTVPEGYALTASNQGPSAIRKNGGWEILEEVYLKKAGAVILAWGENMTSYNTYLSIMPKIGPDGVPDLTGVKMRATGTYRPLFRALGASTINIKSSEIFTAMQRGTVQGFGFPDVSIVPLGFHKVAKYRITPNYYQSNNMVTVNPATWNGLTRKQKSFLKGVAIEYETESVKWIEQKRADEEKVLRTSGVKDVALTGAAAAKYLDVAHQQIWKELKKRSDYHDRLKPLLYVPGKPNRQVNFGTDTRHRN